MIAGDVEPEEVRPLVEETYGDDPGAAAISAQRVRPQEPAPVAPRTVTLCRSARRAAEPAALLPRAVRRDRRGRRKPQRSKCWRNCSAAARNTCLYRALVVDKPLAVSAGACYQGTALDLTQFAISVSPKPGVEFSQSRAGDRRRDRRCHHRTRSAPRIWSASRRS